MHNITEANAADFDFRLSDGTLVEFSKVTGKNNIQVRLPDSHPDGAIDPLRIFRRDGSHYKDDMNVTLSATPKAAAATPTAAPVVAANDDDLTGKIVIIDGTAYSLTRLAAVVAELEAA